MTDLFRRSYVQRVLSVAGDVRLAYWPMGEPSGAVAVDAGRRFNGAYTAVALNQPGIGDGSACPSFDGSTSFCNIYSAGLGSAFNASEGSFGQWFRVPSAGVWSDATNRYGGILRASAANLAHIRKTTTTNQMQWSYVANSVNKSVSFTLASDRLFDWHFAMITWSASADQMKAYLDGVQVGTTQTGLGVWAGALSSTTVLLGASTQTPASPWSGYLAHTLLANRAYSAAEVAELYRIN